MKTLLALAAFLVLAVPASAARAPIIASQDWWPVYSPDGRALAFTRISGNAMTLEVLDLRAHAVHRIAANRGQLSPSWSSGGGLAFSLGGQIYTSAADGAGRQRLTSVGHSYAPAWRPGSDEIAYVTTRGAQNTDLWVASTLWARNAIGKPAWSPDGKELAFQRDDGVYLAFAPGQERRLATVDNPGPPAWSPDGTRVAYTAHGRVWVAPADGSPPPAAVTASFTDLSPLSWSRQGDQLTYTRRGGLELTTLNGRSELLFAGAGVGASFSPVADLVTFSAPRPACPGHKAIRIYEDNANVPVFTGTCEIRGTAGADVIDGTGSQGDVILAGAGNDRIHANDRHIDRVDCGRGRDTVWADRTDKLSGCETVHR